MSRPEIRDIAVCKHGHIGLVLDIVDGPDGKLWTGIHLDLNDVGKLWQSKAPERLVRMSDYF